MKEIWERYNASEAEGVDGMSEGMRLEEDRGKISYAWGKNKP